MIKLRSKTLQQKKGCVRVSRARTGIMELELDLLQDLTMEGKSSFPFTKSAKLQELNLFLSPGMKMIMYVSSLATQKVSYKTLRN